MTLCYSDLKLTITEQPLKQSETQNRLKKQIDIQNASHKVTRFIYVASVRISAVKNICGKSIQLYYYINIVMYGKVE